MLALCAVRAVAVASCANRIKLSYSNSPPTAKRGYGFLSLTSEKHSLDAQIPRFRKGGATEQPSRRTKGLVPK